MSRAVVPVAALAGVVGAAVGAATTAVVGAVVGAIVGAAGAAVVVGWEDRRVGRLARRAREWREGAHAVPIQRSAGPAPWRRLAIAVDRLGGELSMHRRQLQDRAWRLELVDSLVSPAVLFDHEGLFVAANDPARGLFGIPVGEGPRTPIQVLGSGVLADAVARARDGRAAVEVDATVGDRQVRAAVARMGDETLVIANDRTREHQVEELRRNFVVNASHELKTPASSIQALSEALEITAVGTPERVPALVERLRGESDRLVRLVHDLLDLRRLEEPGEVERVPVDLAQLARGVLGELGERADERGVEIALMAPDEAWMAGDADDLHLLVRNLVANAIQYNRDGGHVGVRISAVDDDTWELEVADTGIGIPTQDLQRIFERFYRVDVARSRQTGGTGLGLSLVRHVVVRHRGTIRVDSLLGEGTTFRVRFPRSSSTDVRTESRRAAS